MRRICFLPYNATSWSEMLPVASLLTQRRLAEPVILLADWRMAAFGPDCKRAGLSYRALGCGQSAENETWAKRLRGHATLWRERLTRRLRGEGGLLELAQRREIKSLSQQSHELAQVLDELAPESTVVYSGRIPNWELPLLGHCRQRGIPSLTIPTAYVSHKDALLWSRNSFWHQADRFPGLKTAYPGQTARSSASAPEKLFFPAFRTAALGELGLLPPNPWAAGGGHVTVVMAEGEEARERFVREGADPGAIVVTGHRVHDELWRGLRERTRPEDGEPPLVVMALPQLAEHDVLPWEEHWREIRFLCEVLRDHAPRCLISLHPKMDFSKYAFIETEYGLPLSRESLSKIITRADVFMATLSSTVMWAMLCRIPIIMFDFYGINLTMEGIMDGLISLDRKGDLAQTLAGLLDDPGRYGEMAAAQDRLAARLSPMDGKCTDRILDTILEEVLGR